MPNRQEVYKSLDSERDYQEAKIKLHGPPRDSQIFRETHSMDAYLTFMQDYLLELQKVRTRGWGLGPQRGIDIIRKVTGLGVACMEDHGAPLRPPLRKKPILLRDNSIPAKGLIIREPWIDLILDGKKVWELRSKNTKIRGRIALIRAGSGKIAGTVELIDSFYMSTNDFYDNKDKHQVAGDSSYYSAWVLENPQRYEVEKSYRHPRGAVIWVNL